MQEPSVLFDPDSSEAVIRVGFPVAASDVRGSREWPNLSLLCIRVLLLSVAVTGGSLYNC